MLWLLVFPAHHVIVTVEVPVTNEVSHIRVIRRPNKIVVDLNHGGRTPQLP